MGAGGELVCTDSNPANASLAEGYLSAAGLWQRVRYRDRIRVGGLWLCDNTIWSGYVATATDRECQAGVTAFIREHNRMVAEDTRYVGSSVPIRNGVMTALRIE